jgi:apolipoprotein N-acyltransferase
MSRKALSHQLASIAASQHRSIAAFRAIEQRRAHGGVSDVKNPFGERTLELRTDEYAHEFVSIPLPALPSTSEKWAITSLPVGTGLIVHSLLGYSNRFRRSMRSTLHGLQLTWLPP